jgi:hypothetical protein
MIQLPVTQTELEQTQMTTADARPETSPDTSEIASLRRLFDNLYRDLEQLLADLPDEALLWKPFESSPWQGESNSLGKIIAHAISSTVYLLRRAEYSMGRCEWDEVDGDEGPEEFGPANYNLDYLRARVKRTQEYVHSFLESVTPETLAASRPHPKRPTTLRARQDTLHALEHLSQHIGHAQLTRQLWAIQASQ